jgi:uncharacterized phage infection (PIP) family protein YhgE
MSAVDDIVQHLQAVVDQLSDAVNAAQAGHNAADEGLTHAIPAGHEPTIAGYNSVKEGIDGLINQLNGVKDTTEDLINEAKSITGG